MHQIYAWSFAISVLIVIDCFDTEFSVNMWILILWKCICLLIACGVPFQSFEFVMRLLRVMRVRRGSLLYPPGNFNISHLGKRKIILKRH